MNMELEFHVVKQSIKRTDGNAPVSESVNYLTAEFNFDSSDWDNTVKTATFRSGVDVYTVLLDESNKCLVPWEVVRAGKLKVSVYGDGANEYRITADTVEVPVYASGYSEGEESQHPTPSQYEQLAGIISTKSSVVVNPADSATGTANKIKVDGTTYAINGGGGGGTDDYTDLNNKPSINGNTLSGNKTSNELGLQSTLTFDNSPTSESNNPVKSGGIFTALGEKVDKVNGKGLSTNDYTDADKTKLDGLNQVTANPTLAGTESDLTGLEIGNTKFKVPSGGGSGTTVVANPTLVGGEDALSSLQVGSTLYKVEGDVTTKLLIDSLYARNRKHDFAWGKLPHAMIALVVDDCLPDVISGCVNNAQAKNIPLNMAIIVDKFNQQATNETVLQAIKRGIANGGEALMHGNGIITADNIDNESYLKTCFLTKKEVAIQNGINPRGFIVMGGGGEIYGDPRTDRWVRALYDYSDGYGLEGIEPYYHRRLGCTSLSEAKTYIDNAVANNKFIVIFAHKWWDWWNDMIDYAKAQGAEFVTYAYVYDKYGSTKAEKASEARIKALEDVVYAKTLTSITASKVATTYYEGSTLDTSDITVEAHFDNGTTADVSGSEDVTIDTQNVDMSTAGTYTIGVSYEYEGVTKSTSIAITVEAIPQGQVLDSISASKTTTSYVQNSTLVTSDITVTATYTNSNTADVTSNANIDATNVNMAVVGTYAINITYSEGGITKTTSITITVTEDQGTLIYSKSSLTKAVSSSDEKFGAKINVTSGKKYVYDFDIEVTSGGFIDIRPEATGQQFSPMLRGDKETGWTDHITCTVTSAQTREREPFVAKYISSAYTVKLTNITIREKN